MNSHQPEHLLCAKRLRLHTSPLNFTVTLQETSYLHATEEELRWRRALQLAQGPHQEVVNAAWFSDCRA